MFCKHLLHVSYMLPGERHILARWRSFSAYVFSFILHMPPLLIRHYVVMIRLHDMLQLSTFAQARSFVPIEACAERTMLCEPYIDLRVTRQQSDEAYKIRNA